MPQIAEQGPRGVFAAEQRVVWHYTTFRRRRQVILVEAEVVQPGPLRVRIRVRTQNGSTLLRWVHPKNLRPKEQGELVQSYPESVGGGMSEVHGT